MTDYAELESACRQRDLDFTAAEVHGALTGMLCVNGAVAPEEWLALVDIPRAVSADDDNTWVRVYRLTLSQLADGDFEFQLLLPPDDIPLQQRTEALADWCRGFLYGVSNSKLKQQMELSDDVAEVIDDLTQISRAGHDSDDDGDAEEAAYMELVEYVRAGAMLVYAELQLPLTSAKDQDTLH